MTEHLLVLSPFFLPEPISTGKYNGALVKALVSKGIAVDVICFHPLYPDWKPYKSNEGLPGVRITRGGGWIRYPKSNFLRRVVLEVGYFMYIFRSIRRFKHYSRIIAIVPPMLYLPLVKMITRSDVKIITIVHDLQGIMAGVSLNRTSSGLTALVRYLEKWILGCAHQIIALSAPMASYISAVYNIRTSKITVCRPFVTITPHPESTQISHLFTEDKYHIVYAGALGEKQYPKGLLALFMNLIRKREDVICHIFSGGPIFEHHKQAANTRHHRLIFHDLVAEQDLYELYTRSHIQVIPQKNGFAEGAMPSKLPNLLASGVPILYIGQSNSEVRQIIQENNAGVCVQGWDIRHLSTTVEQMLRTYDGRGMKKRCRTFQKHIASRFSVESLIRALLK